MYKLIHDWVGMYGYVPISTGTIKFDVVHHTLSIEVDETPESASDKRSYKLDLE